MKSKPNTQKKTHTHTVYNLRCAYVLELFIRFFVRLNYKVSICKNWKSSSSSNRNVKWIFTEKNIKTLKVTLKQKKLHRDYSIWNARKRRIKNIQNDIFIIEKESLHFNDDSSIVPINFLVYTPQKSIFMWTNLLWY